MVGGDPLASTCTLNQFVGCRQRCGCARLRSLSRDEQPPSKLRGSRERVWQLAYSLGTSDALRSATTSALVIWLHVRLDNERKWRQPIKPMACVKSNSPTNPKRGHRAAALHFACASMRTCCRTQRPAAMAAAAASRVPIPAVSVSGTGRARSVRHCTHCHAPAVPRPAAPREPVCWQGVHMRSSIVRMRASLITLVLLLLPGYVP